MSEKKSPVSTGILVSSILGAALLAVAGFSAMQPTGEQSKLVYDGKLWCVSNFLEQEPQEILNDGRPRQDKLLDDKQDWIVREQVSADTEDEAEKIAQANGHGLFERSDKATMRAALTKTPPDKAFFTSHFNHGATIAGPCLGGGSSHLVGMWLNDRILKDCFNIQSSSGGCGFDTNKLSLYSGGGADPGAKYAQTDDAKQYAINTLKIDSSIIKQFSKIDVENMIRAEISKQFAQLSNKYGSAQTDAQQAILSYQLHESGSFQLFDSSLHPSYTHDSSGDALNIMSLTNDKFNSKNKRIAASYDIKYAIYLGVKENMNAFLSSSVSGNGKDRWHNSIGYVFWPSNPNRYWTDSRGDAAVSAWNTYSGEIAYVCPAAQAATDSTAPVSPDCPTNPPAAGPSSGSDVQAEIAKQFEAEQSARSQAEAAAAAATSSGQCKFDESAEQAIVSEAMKYAPNSDGTTKVKYVSGGRSPSSGFDCSGFVDYVLKHAKAASADIDVGSTVLSTAQASVGQVINKIDINKFTLANGGAKLRTKADMPKIEDLRPGDIIFFGTATQYPDKKKSPNMIGHVGIYLGNGKYIQSTSSDPDLSKDSASSANPTSEPPFTSHPQGNKYANYNGVKISDLYDSYFTPGLYIQVNRVTKPKDCTGSTGSTAITGKADEIGKTANPGGSNENPSFRSCHGRSLCNPGFKKNHNTVNGYSTGNGDAVDISTDGNAYAAFDGTATKRFFGKSGAEESRPDLYGIQLVSDTGSVNATYLHVTTTNTGKVKAGQKIGRLYPLSRPHIHFELSVDGKIVHGDTSLRSSASSYVKSLWSNMEEALGLAI